MSLDVQRNTGTQVRTTNTGGDSVAKSDGTTAGAGVSNSANVTTEEVTTNISLAMQLGSALRQFAPQSSKDFEVILAEVSNKMKDVSSDTQTERVIANQEIQKLNSLENQEKADKALKKAEEAEAKKKDGALWAKISEVASYVGAALLAAVGTAVIIFSAGSLAMLGGLMIASAVVMTMGLIDAQVQKDNDGMGMFAWVMDKVIEGGINEKQVMAFNIASAAINATLSIILAVATGNVAAASSAITAIKAIAVGIDVATTVTASTADIGSNVVKQDAAHLTKQSENARSDGLDIQANNAALQDVVDQALKMLMDAADSFNAMIDSVVSMMNEKGKSMQNTQFVG